MRRVPIAALLAGATIVGCGSSSPAPRTSARPERSVPALAGAPRQPGEIVVRGEATPKTAGPFRFTGTYRVRFVQYAPEDPRLDFGAETPFVAGLTRTDGQPVRRLFRAAASRGSRTVRLSGRYVVDASFGDYPFALRFTRVRG
ncbi:MAG: hypothetical protein ABI950_13335 [Solirubrobacteraceae bacterium]